ncbi:hypothetical protein M3D57_05805 [Corynebacterium sanguinis]|uniref:PhzF family phenazine biosynthesis protein n=1 Tax=Corynebacterium lipophiloflavum (strain ATCC 700352 / DSM 44291 / CCUG 37336 / JCM 10383 / DMMZ 1944) TaxID=525263 RepID=C0XPM7_CORLD|nr:MULTISPECIES: hypothetical protein [Corynebacterium]EEI17802.1 hypothetical protein HMPREF0298_0397 [Corynebacterium lipophiloflavum DSM 44291]MCT1555159.1 hypothetical protein [Corynebacterium sanguinis]MCT2047016.1 hypothetical protein [Corynebacterium sanguinis]MCT2155085.1 hypothetical protein [Corynebacterium sanguinis]
MLGSVQIVAESSSGYLGRAGRIELDDDGETLWVGGAVRVRVRGVLGVD